MSTPRSLSKAQVTSLEAFIVQSMSSTTPSKFLTLFSTTLNSAGEWDKDGYNCFRNALGDFSFAMGFSSDSQNARFMSGGPTCPELDKRFLACLASYAPPDRQAEVRGYETTTKLIEALDAATASRDTTGTLMDLLHQATDLSTNALSGMKASDTITKLLDLGPALNRAVPVVPRNMTYADMFLIQHASSCCSNSPVMIPRTNSRSQSFWRMPKHFSLMEPSKDLFKIFHHSCASFAEMKLQNRLLPRVQSPSALALCTLL